MRKAIQRLFIELGEAACYAICIVKHAETALAATFTDGQVLDYLIAGIDWGYIYYNWNDPADNDNFLVLDAASFLSRLSKQSWIRSAEDASYVPKPGELVTALWERRTASGATRHFANPDYDPMGNALTIAQGKIVGYRIFRKKA